VSTEIFTHVLQIPSMFSAQIDLMMSVGWFIFSVMFIAAVLSENIQALEGRSGYGSLFVRVLMVVSFLILYDRVFTWTVYGFELLSDAVLPEEEFRQVLAQVFKEFGDGKDLGILGFLSVLTVINLISYAVALSLVTILGWLRFIFLSLLYVIGPLAGAFAVFRPAATGLSFWFRSMVSVSAWTVVLSLLMKVISTMNLTAVYQPENTNQAAVLAANLLFILLFIFVPVITHQITSGGTVNSTASAVLGIGTAFVTRHIARASQLRLPARASQNENKKGEGKQYTFPFYK